jgi:response regulator RpfG family c-di-GMP phosphodiesterase
MSALEQLDDDLLFADEDDTVAEHRRTWKIMVVDDEPSIHDVTRLALSDFTFQDRPLEFVSVYSGQDAREAIIEHPDTAIMLLDVVMESEHAGLDVARFVREEAGNTSVRIILRTGQPGQAPERQVITDYDINDYKEKTELTAQKLSTLMYASLRSFRDITSLEKNKRGLEAVIEASANIFELKSMEHFTQGVLEQMSSLLHTEVGAVYCKTDGLAASCSKDGYHVVAATGCYGDLVGTALSREVAPDVVDSIEDAMKNGCNVIRENCYTGLIKGRQGTRNILYLSGIVNELSDIDRSLLDVFQRNASIAFENVELIREIEQTQREIVYTLGETVETRSKETGNHVKRVAEISKLLALDCGMDAEEAEILKFASPLHDIGKIGIPDAILNKPGKLDAEEWEIMKSHTLLGYDMLKSSKKRILRAGAIIARDHHEKWAGGGYPYNKKGEDIHLYGRITAVADVFDALGSERCYKKAWPLDRIIDLMKTERGRHFEPAIVDSLLANLDKVTNICEANRD